MSLESILNWLIPTVVILIFIGFIYWKLQEPTNFIFRWIGKMFMNVINSLSETLQSSTKEITYK